MGRQQQRDGMRLNKTNKPKKIKVSIAWTAKDEQLLLKLTKNIESSMNKTSEFKEIAVEFNAQAQSKRSGESLRMKYYVLMKQANGKYQVDDNEIDEYTENEAIEMWTNSNNKNQMVKSQEVDIPKLEQPSSLKTSIESPSPNEVIIGYSNNNNQRKRKLNDSESSEELEDDRPLKRRRKIQNEEEEEVKLYCICKRPYDNKPMLQCTFCAEWYHYECQELINDPNQPIDKSKFECSECIQSRLKSL